MMIIEFWIYQRVNGNQLVSLLVQAFPRLHILTVSRTTKHQSALSAAALLLTSLLWPAVAEPRLQERAPALIVTIADGRDFDLATMRGKVVPVAFWATWCGPCLEEMPALEKYYREHKAEGFEVIALSVDKPGNRAKAFRVLAKFSFPGAMISDASSNGFGTPEAVPVSYLVDPQGIVRERFIALDGGLLDEVITPLLKKSSAAAIPAVFPPK
jgi:thiol-disulfide isomerase/thioredoxin